MRILLLSMPDSFEHTPAFVACMPNVALATLAGNVDPHHSVAVADLILVQHEVRQAVERLLGAFEPDLVGLSVMTFQRRTARRIIRLVRLRAPSARVVVGGYDPSLASEAWADAGDAAAPDYIVRGEGEATFSELLRVLECNGSLSTVAGLSYRDDDRFIHNPPRPVADLRTGVVRRPRRDARVLHGYSFMGRPVDVVETSRGCTFHCTFCSIVEMRGRSFHAYPIERVVADLQDARSRGARSIFFADDNIVLDVRRLEALCQAIVDAGLHDMDYLIQATTSSIANHGVKLAPLMRRAGFRYVFLGIENVMTSELAFLNAETKNTRPKPGGRPGHAAIQAIEILHRQGMYVVGGLIVGNPEDTRTSVEANLEFARRYVDWPYIQHPTPYPGTPMQRELEEMGLIANRNLEEYDGTSAVVRTAHLEPGEVEFMRWRAERWMKLRHMPAALMHDPSWVLRNAHRMLGHTFRGCNWRTLLGLEDERRAFERYRVLRRAEREYLPEMSSSP